MKPKRAKSAKAIVVAQRSFEGLVRELRAFITESRRQIVRAVDVAQVQTCWGVGRYIVEFEQEGENRAKFGSKLLPRLAESLTADFGRGFEQSSLSRMRQFYLAFPIFATVSQELTWSHYRTLLRVEDAKAREWYINEAIAQNWSVRALDRQINRLYYERLLSSTDKKAVRAEAAERIAELPPSPRDFVRDPVLLEFLAHGWHHPLRAAPWTAATLLPLSAASLLASRFSQHRFDRSLARMAGRISNPRLAPEGASRAGFQRRQQGCRSPRRCARLIMKPRH